MTYRIALEGNEHIRCVIGGKRLNHIVYADDLTLVSPSHGIQRLVEVCAESAMKDDSIFNPVKSGLLAW